MFPYVVIFFLVYLISLLWEKNKNNKRISIISSILIVIILAIFSGIRDETVGTDVLGYAKPIITTMNNLGFQVVRETANVEILYVVLAWLTSLLKGNLNLFLFLTQLLINIIIVISANKNKDKISISTFILAYMTIFYGITFNLMRQSIAIAITIFSYHYIEKQDIKKFLLCIIIASGFHMTSIVFIPVYFVYNLGNNKKGIIFKFLFISFLIILLLGFNEIFSFFIDIGILPIKYESYLTKYYQNEIDIQIKATFLKILIFFVCYYILYLENKENFKLVHCMRFLLTIDFILFLLGSRILYAERISYYYSIFVYMYVLSSKNLNKSLYLKIFILILLLLYAYITFGILNVSSIIPYTSSILGIS